MANIPTQTQQEVREQPLPVAAPSLDATLKVSGQGMEALGQAGESITNSIVSMVQRSRHEADVANHTAAENELQQSIDTALYAPPPSADSSAAAEPYSQPPSDASDTDRPQSPLGMGLTYRKGEDAVAASQEAYKYLGQERQRIAEKYFGSDAKARETFLLRSGGLIEDAHRVGERHVGQEIEASNQADMQRGQQLALRAVAVNPLDDDTAALQTARMEAPLRAMARNRASGDAAVEEWRATVTQSRLDLLLRKGNPDSAEAAKAIQKAREVFDSGKGSLDAKVAERYQDVLDKRQTDVDGTHLAGAAIAQARDKLTGFVNRNLVDAYLEKQPDSPAKQVALRDAVRRLALAKQAEKDQKDEWWQQASGAYNRSGYSLAAVDPTVKRLLQTYDNDAWHRLKNWSDQDNREALARAEGRATVDTTAQQNLLYDAKRELTRPENAELYLGMSAEQMFAKLDPKGALSQRGRRELGEVYAGLHGPKTKTAVTPADRFRAVDSFVTSELKFHGPAAKWSAGQKAIANHIDAHIKEMAEENVRRKGVAPDMETMMQWGRDEAAKGYVQGTGIGGSTYFEQHVSRAEWEADPRYKGLTWVDDATKQPHTQAELHKPPDSIHPPANTASGPADKAVTGYRYNKGRTKRAPVYKDGTQGPLEAVNGGGG